MRVRQGGGVPPDSPGDFSGSGCQTAAQAGVVWKELRALTNDTDAPATRGNAGANRGVVGGGRQKKEIAALAGVSRPTVDLLWLKRYEADGSAVCWIDRPGQGGSRFRRRCGLGFWRRVGPVHPPKLAFLNKAVTGTSWVWVPVTLHTSRHLLILVEQSAESVVSSYVVDLGVARWGSGRRGAAWPRVRCGRWLV
jgi:hypothetical protein